MNFSTNINIEQFCFLFFVYSFLGWVCESIYKSIEERKFVNSGFLYGPYVPIYGFGSLLTISAEIFFEKILPFELRVIIYTLLATILEYYTGLICEVIFGVRLWDYSDKPFNLKGRICLQYSMYWLLLNALNIGIIYPYLTKFISSISLPIIALLNRILIPIILIDFLFACKTLHKIVAFFDTLNREYLSVTRELFLKYMESFKHFFGNFPNLAQYIKINIRNNIMSDFNKNVYEFINEDIIEEREGNVLIRNGKSDEKEFYEIIEDILNNPSFQQLKNFRHHDGTIYDHSKAVAYFTFKYCRNKKLDYKSACRGAILHDFFLYDWRTGKDKDGIHHKGHIYLHPKMALENSEKNFKLNDLERDIILNHMWPLSPSFPKYKETFVVSFIDKYISTKEFLVLLQSSLKNRMLKKAE